MTAPNRFRFRAWDKVNNKMIYPSRCDNIYFDVEDGSFYAEAGPAGLSYSKPLLELVPLQSTGLLDKNGVEIFEGDVIKYGDSDCLYKVGWSAPEFALFDWPDYHYGDGWLPWPEHKDRNRVSLLVLGNIYEHPELKK